MITLKERVQQAVDDISDKEDVGHPQKPKLKKITIFNNKNLIKILPQKHSR